MEIKKLVKRAFGILSAIVLATCSIPSVGVAAANGFEDVYSTYSIYMGPVGINYDGSDIQILTKDGVKTLTGMSCSVPGNITVSDGNKSNTLSDALIVVKEKGNLYNNVVWCIDPFHIIPIDWNAVTESMNYQALTEATEMYEHLPEKKLQKVREILSVGFGYEEDYSAERHTATQVMIWKTVVGNNAQITGTAYTNEVKAKEDEMNALLESHTKKPNLSTSAKQENGKYVLTGLGKQNGITFTDSNNVLANFNKVKITGDLDYQIDGNQLTVWADKADSKTGRLVASNSGLVASIDPLKKDKLLACEKGMNGQYLGQNLVDITGEIDPTNFYLDFEIIAGEARLSKIDAETQTTTQGDATFNGAVFSLLDETTGQKVGKTIKVGKDGKTSEKWSDLDTTHTYKIIEETAPKGYQINGNGMNVVFDTEGKANIEFPDSVITGQVEITKSKNDVDGSGWTKPEEGAEFTILLKSHVDKYKTFKEALAKKDELTAKEYSIMTTDATGFARSGRLAYGQYVLKQTKAAEGYGMVEEEMDITISRQDQVIKLTSTNNAIKYRLKLVKVDENGETITFTSAKFKLKNVATGEYVRQVIGSKSYDTFQTAATSFTGKAEKGTFIVADPDTPDYGNVVLPLEINAGEYVIEEVQTPVGYVGIDSMTINVGEGLAEEIDGIAYKTFNVENKTATGRLEINKVFEMSKADKVFEGLLENISEKVNQVRFALVADEDIINPLNGETTTKKGELVVENPVETSEAEGSIRFTTSFNSILPGKYLLKETSTIPGFDKAADLRVEVINNQVEKQVETYVNGVMQDKVSYTDETDPDAYTVINKSTVIEFSKEDAGGKEVPGARITVEDEDGNVIDDWTSTNVSHKITGLTSGKTYKMIEVIAPDGYNLANEFKFTAGETNHITMVDTITSVHKKDQNKEWVVGAKLRVVDEDGKTVDEWVTKAEAHNIKGMKVGKTYTLKEVTTPKTVKKTTKVYPDGTTDYEETSYKKAKDITFTVSADKDEIIVMTDMKSFATGLKGNVLPFIGLGAAAVLLAGAGGYYGFKKYRKHSGK